MRRLSTPAIGLLGLGVLACSSADSSPADPPVPEPIPEAVQRAFEGSCMNEGCHDATARAADLSLDASDSIAVVGGPSSQSELPLVVLGDLHGSYMAIKLLPDGQLPPGAIRHEERMPLDGVEDDDVENLNIILSWIAGFGPSATDGDPTSGSASTGDGTADGSGPTADSGTGTTGGDDDPTDPGPTTNSGGGPTNPACSVEEITEGVVADPLDKGDGAGQIPSLVGVVFEERCGCHTLTDRELNTKFPALLAPAGTLFLDYGDVVSQGAILEEAMFGVMNMPPGSCPPIPADDLSVLDKWFTDGLPDGAAFEPP